MIKRISLIVSLFLLMTSCHKSDFSVHLKEKISLVSVRFDRKIMKLDTLNFSKVTQQLQTEHPTFFSAYSQQILKAGNIEQSHFQEQMLRFVHNDITKEVYQLVDKTYQNVEDIDKAISLAYSYYQYYFPSQERPTIYYFMSGFNQRVVIDSAILGIGLDMCLGANCKYYDQLGVPEYMKHKMDKSSIAVDVMKGLTWSNFPFSGDENLAANMIYEGKIQYLLTALFPESPDSIKFAYSQTDLDWLLRNENKVWETIVDEQMLYATERIKIRNMVGNAPFTQPFGHHSPPQVGVWIGYRIVKNYMERHPEMGIPDLMKINDYASILNDSGYNP